MTPLRRLKDAVRRSPARDIIAALRGLITEVRFALLHLGGRLQARKFRNAHGLRLNIGAGADLRQGWVNIDLEKGADLRLDGRRPLPLPDGCASIVYSEHFLEHLELEDTVRWLAETFRVLEPGGKLSVVVPDAREPIREYITAGTGPLLSHALARGWHEGAETPLDQINI